MNIGFYVAIAVAVLVVLVIVGITRWILSLRRVVAPNEVHVVRQSKGTRVFGKVNKETNPTAVESNAYYEWPEWIPRWGVNVTKLDLSIFTIDLKNYSAYDKGRLPFKVDIQAFFRIADFEMAASRISGVEEMQKQLDAVLQGSSRSLLANEELEELMGKRNEYGAKFTTLVKDQLKSWGVEAVKNIELMDIRDVEGEQVVENITKKKKSEIDRDARKKVAQNEQEAKEAEIASQKAIALKEQDKALEVGKKTAEVNATVGMANEATEQKIQDQKKLTAEKKVAVENVEKVGSAKNQREADVINADAGRQTTVLKAQGDLDATKLRAQGIEAEGNAKAAADKAGQMASVAAQTALAKEIGENEGYQQYLIQKEQINANREVGLKQAENLGNADIKIVANGSDVPSGISKAAGALAPQTGFNIGGLLEALTGTPEGKRLVDGLVAMLTGKQNDAPAE